MKIAFMVYANALNNHKYYKLLSVGRKHEVSFIETKLLCVLSCYV